MLSPHNMYLYYEPTKILLTCNKLLRRENLIIWVIHYYRNVEYKLFETRIILFNTVTRNYDSENYETHKHRQGLMNTLYSPLSYKCLYLIEIHQNS